MSQKPNRNLARKAPTRDTALSDLLNEVQAWRRLWCDRPEDRLYHAKDHTWWARDSHEDEPPWVPHKASPPPEIMTIVQAARSIPNKSPELTEALSYFPEVMDGSLSGSSKGSQPVVGNNRRSGTAGSHRSRRPR